MVYNIKLKLEQISTGNVYFIFNLIENIGEVYNYVKL